MGLVSICTPFLLSTPPYFFWWFFFRNVTKLYKFCNDTCFLSVRLRNLTGHVITPFLAFGMLRNLTDCVIMLPFDFRHVTESHELCNNASFWSLACHRTSRIVQQRVPSTSKRLNKGCMPSNNGTRTKLGYDIMARKKGDLTFISNLLKRKAVLKKRKNGSRILSLYLILTMLC